MSTLMQELYSVRTTVLQEAPSLIGSITHSYVDKDITNVCILRSSELEPLCMTHFLLH